MKENQEKHELDEVCRKMLAWQGSLLMCSEDDFEAKDALLAKLREIIYPDQYNERCRLQAEINKEHEENYDLKNEIQSLKSQISTKDKEIEGLNAELEAALSEGGLPKTKISTARKEAYQEVLKEVGRLKKDNNRPGGASCDTTNKRANKNDAYRDLEQFIKQKGDL